MSSGVDLPVSYANVTPIGEWDSTWMLRGLCLLESFFGITFNILVLWISISRWNSLATFKWFFTNLALADLVYAIIELGCETHLISDWEKMHVYMEGFLVSWDYYWARVAFLWHYGGAFEVYIAPMFIFINRYVVLCMPSSAEQKYFSGAKTLLYFLLGHMVSFTSVICVGYISPERIIYQQLRDEDPRYNYTQPLNTLGWRTFYVLFSATAVACYSTSIWCTYKVHKRLQDHQKLATGLIDTEKLAENKAMLRTIMIQGLTPVFFFLPVAFTCTLLTVGGFLQIRHHMFVNWSINLIKSNGAMDGFMTLLTVKPYRRVLEQYLEKMGLKKKKESNKPKSTGSKVSTIKVAAVEEIQIKG